ncbi:hypothetical protein J6590_107227, partial [Homalodisca vitripennis]
ECLYNIANPRRPMLAARLGEATRRAEDAAMAQLIFGLVSGPPERIRMPPHSSIGGHKPPEPGPYKSPQ